MPIVRATPTRLPNATMNLYASGSMVQLPTNVTQVYDVEKYIDALEARLKQLGIWTE